MSRNSLKLCSLGFAALAFLVVPARAEVVLSNQTESVGYDWVNTDQWRAVSFVTNNQAWTLTSPWPKSFSESLTV
jgi:hypothetical protein